MPQTAEPSGQSPLRAAGKDKTSDTAISVAPGTTADASLSEHAPSTDGRQTLIDDIARIRKIRQPFGSSTQKLALPKRAGYHRHWFNDSPGRVEEALNSGWAHVQGRDGKPIKRVVGTGRDNGALNAYAMELPEVFWQEDQAARDKMASDKMDALKANPFRAKTGQAQKSDIGKFYSPQEEQGHAPLEITKT
jgi:hypothetical protein